MKRIKLTFSNAIYKELLDDIRQANRDLREVTHHNIVLEPIKRKRLSRRPLADLKMIRRNAASLHRVFMNDKAWKCKCKMHHMASLRLETRPQSNEFKAEPDNPQIHAFRILLSVTGATSNTNTAIPWEDIEVVPTIETGLNSPSNR